MRVRSFIELKIEYDEARGGLDLDDVNERNLLLIQFPNSVIVECDWVEFENLEKWISENIDETPLNEIGYGKTGYDYWRGSSNLLCFYTIPVICFII